jgi:hypothetical protein
MKSKTSTILPFLLSVFSQAQNERVARLRPTGGHRGKGYSVTRYDFDRIQAAAERRAAKAAKRHHSYLRGLANDPCRGAL